MTKRSSMKIILFIVLAFTLFLFGAGCTKAEVDFNRDGSGTVTLKIAKTEENSYDSVMESIEDVIAKVNNVSGGDDRLRLKSLKEHEEGYVAKLKFMRIHWTKGIGEYNYMDSKEFLLVPDETKLVTYWANGAFDANYEDSNGWRYYLSNPATVATPFKPILAETKEEIAPADFISEGGILNNEKGKMFTFLLVDTPGIESITFSFKGKILAYGSPNIEQIDDSTIVVKPTTVKTRIATVEDGGVQATTKEISCFQGYVFFEMGMSGWVIGAIIVGSVLLLGLIGFGIYKGFFKKVFHGRRFRSIRRNWSLYAMMLPALALLGTFAYAPMTGIVMAFKNYKIDDGIFGSEWTSLGGFRHFWDLFTSPGVKFGMLARNTLILAFWKFVLGFVCAIVLAVLFSYLKTGAFKKTVQTISYFPYFISWVTISSVAYLFLAQDGGMLNQILAMLHIEPINWYNSPQYWRTILTFTSLWKTVGYSTIVYLAAITAINPSLYEACEIDGGGRLRQLYHITIPGLFPVLGVQVIFSLGNLVRDDFDQIITMTNNNAALNETTQVIGTVVFNSIGTASAYSSAAAMSVLQGVVAMALVLISNKLVKKAGIDGAF